MRFNFNGMEECWNIGKMGSDFRLVYPLKTIIPSFHYSNIPSEAKPQ
jgi:hypothetical protein